MKTSPTLEKVSQNTLVSYETQFKKGRGEARNIWQQMAFSYIAALFDTKTIEVDVYVDLQKEIHLWKPEPPCHEFAFDVTLKAVIRAKGLNENDARHWMAGVQAYDLDHTVASMDMTITEISVDSIGDCFEIDGEHIERSKVCLDPTGSTPPTTP